MSAQGADKGNAGCGGFPGLRKAAGPLVSGEGREPTDEELTRIICSDCPFYREGEEEELECGAYRLLELLLRNGELSVAQLLRAVEDHAP